jgi:hypothetical protein
VKKKNLPLKSPKYVNAKAAVIDNAIFATATAIEIKELLKISLPIFTVVQAVL